MGTNYFAYRLSVARKKNGYTCKEMAQLIPCNFFRYKMFEKGKCFPHPWEIRRIEELIGKTFKELSNPFNPQFSWNRARLLNPTIERTVFDLREHQDELKILPEKRHR